MARKKNNKRIPDRWMEYHPIKSTIGDTRIVAFKVPLPLNLFQDEFMSKHKWTPIDVMEAVPNLGLVIDLTFKFPCYYEPLQFLDNGVDYVKIGCAGQVIPQNETFVKFSEAIESFHKDHPDQIVGIHCTHGVNRTGYMICRYMVEKLGYTAEKALETFATARGYPVERENYKQHIHETAKPV